MDATAGGGGELWRPREAVVWWRQRCVGRQAAHRQLRNAGTEGMHGSGGRGSEKHARLPVTGEKRGEGMKWAGGRAGRRCSTQKPEPPRDVVGSPPRPPHCAVAHVCECVEKRRACRRARVTDIPPARCAALLFNCGVRGDGMRVADVMRVWGQGSRRGESGRGGEEKSCTTVVGYSTCMRARRGGWERGGNEEEEREVAGVVGPQLLQRYVTSGRWAMAKLAFRQPHGGG